MDKEEEDSYKEAAKRIAERIGREYKNSRVVSQARVLGFTNKKDKEND